MKTPWQSIIKYDTRNNLINFYKDTDYKYDGGSADGKQFTVNDSSGASANIDIQVNYSLDPSAAEEPYCTASTDVHAELHQQRSSQRGVTVGGSTL